jgi:hypothetical protein
MLTTVKQLRLDEINQPEPNDETNDPFHRSAETTPEQGVRKLQHMYLIKELPAT